MLADLARRIGPEAAQILARHYAVTPLYVPNCKPVLLRARDAALLKDRQQLARQGLTERRIVQCLALRYHITERHVWTIFKKPPPPDPARQPQQMPATLPWRASITAEQQGQSLWGCPVSAPPAKP